MHLEVDGDNSGYPDQLCRVAFAADGMRASSRQHAIEDSHSDGGLGLLRLELSCPQPGADERFITSHRRLDQSAPPIAGRRLPSQPTLRIDHVEVVVALSWRTWFGARNSGLARRNHNLDIVAIVRDGLAPS